MDDKEKDIDKGTADTGIGTAGSTLGGAVAGAVAGTALGRSRRRDRAWRHLGGRHWRSKKADRKSNAKGEGGGYVTKKEGNTIEKD